MFCKKCGNPLDNESKFCAHCGALCDANNMPDNAQISNLDEPHQQVSAEPSTNEIFMAQLRALTKTGAKGIKQAATQAQAKAGNLSESIEKSQSLKQLGANKNLFLFVCVALTLNLLLLLSKTIYFELMYFGKGNFTVIGFCSEMLDFIKEYGKYADGANDSPFYMAVKFLEIAGIIFILTAATKTYLPLLTSNIDKPISFKLIKISVIFSISLTFLFMFLCTAMFSSQRGVEFHLTLLGWLYVIESAILIISVLKLSPRVKKNDVSLS